jgi:hypothetical protein
MGEELGTSRAKINVLQRLKMVIIRFNINVREGALVPVGLAIPISNLWTQIQLAAMCDSCLPCGDQRCASS